MTLAEKKVTVEVLKSGRWAQEPWLPQLEVNKGDKVTLSIAVAHQLQEKGKCTILFETIEEVNSAPEKIQKKPAKQIKKKSETNPAARDKKDAEG